MRSEATNGSGPTARPRPDRSDHLVWFDAEFTTLDLDRAHLTQVAMMITDAELRPVGMAKPLVLTIRLPARSTISPWVRRHLAEQLEASRSRDAWSVDAADRRLATEIRRRLGPIPRAIERRPVLAGNSIHTDWWLIRKFLPRVHRCLNYRHLDVSVLKFEWRRLCPELDFEKTDPAWVRRYCPWAWPDGGRPHDAEYDLGASAAELRFYRTYLLRRSVQPPRSMRKVKS